MKNKEKIKGLDHVVIKSNNEYYHKKFNYIGPKKVEEKRSSHRGIVFAILFFLLLFIIMVFVFFSQDDHFDIMIGNKLKYQTKQKEYSQVYITDVSEIVEDVMPSIVSITSKTSLEDKEINGHYVTGTGSGIIIGKSSTELMILTNYHVIMQAEGLRVEFANQKSFDVTVKGVSKEYDLAILSIKLDHLDKSTLNYIKVATVGYSKDLKVGNGVIAIGNVLGYGLSVTTGVISALDREVIVDDYTYKVIQTDASINFGNSGGALLNRKGEVIGINSFKFSHATSSYVEGVGFALPITDVSGVITDLMNENHHYSSLDLGIEGYIINEDYHSFYHLPVGFYVTKIIPDRIISHSSLEVGNIIVKIDQKEIKNYDDIVSVLSNKSAGSKIKFQIKYLSGDQYREREIEIKV